MKLIPINKESKNSNVQLHIDSPDLQVTPGGMFKRQIVFDVIYKNTTSDTLLIDPSKFKYWSIYSDNYTSTDRKYVQCINPDLSLEQMHQNKIALSAAKNPYCLKNKSVGGIMVDGLSEGTINLIFGIDSDDENYETREDKENDWDKEKESTLNSITSNIEFFENKALLKTTLPPNKNIGGKILFPIETKANQIQVILPIGNKSDTVSFKQTIDWY